MTSRDAILERIRTSLADDAELAPPPVAEVWPRRAPSLDEMAARFTQELQAVGGQVHRSSSMEEAKTKFADLVREEGWAKIGGVDRTGCRQLASEISEAQVDWIGADGTPQSMADLEVGLVEADTLLADTGTSMIANATSPERILCYLPPVCVVLAGMDQLVEHLPAAWETIAPRVADPGLRGEFVLVTGPSRTADIEKILILGVHGPKQLIVFLVG